MHQSNDCIRRSALYADLPTAQSQRALIGVQLFRSANNAPRQTTTCPVTLTFKGSGKRLFALHRIPAGAESSAAGAKRGTFFASHKKASRQLLCPFVRSLFLCFGKLHPAGLATGWFSLELCHRSQQQTPCYTAALCGGKPTYCST